MFCPKNLTFFHSKLLLDNSASFTSSRMKDLCQNYKLKLIFRDAGNSLMDWPDWDPTPLFYDRSTPPCRGADGQSVSRQTGTEATNPALGCHCPPGPRLLSQLHRVTNVCTKLYCLVTEAHAYERLAQKRRPKARAGGSRRCDLLIANPAS